MCFTIVWILFLWCVCNTTIPPHKSVKLNCEFCLNHHIDLVYWLQWPITAHSDESNSSVQNDTQNEKLSDDWQMSIVISASPTGIFHVHSY